MLDIKEAADFLRVSITTVRRYVAAGMLPVTQYKKRGKLWFSKDDLGGLLAIRKYIYTANADVSEFYSEASEAEQEAFMAAIQAMAKKTEVNTASGDGFENEED